MTELADLMVATLGEPRFDSSLATYVADRRSNEHYVSENDRVIFHDTVSQLDAAIHSAGLNRSPDELPSFEPGGPRRRLYFAPGSTKVGIVTCGGLCPGLNDVIRGLVMELAKHYGVPQAVGYRHASLAWRRVRPKGPCVSPPRACTTSTSAAARSWARHGARRIQTRWSTDCWPTE